MLTPPIESPVAVVSSVKEPTNNTVLYAAMVLLTVALVISAVNNQYED